MTEKRYTALAMGAFDGLHLGHIKVIDEMMHEKELEPCVLTFKENPSKILKKDFLYLVNKSEKDEIIKNKGVKEIFYLDFNEVKNLSPKDFFEQIIIKKCGAKSLYCGENFRFGKNAEGDIDTLKGLCSQNGVRLNIVPLFSLDGETISSTKIRNLLKDGQVKLANKYLGRNFSFTFKVVSGNKIGRTLGTPTINQPIPKDFIKPKFGVYATAVTVENEKHSGVTNIGIKPTVGSYDPLLETWIPDFYKDMYGMKIKVELLEFIRAEKKFDSIDELKNEIYKNADKAKEIFKIYNKNNF